MHMVHRVHPVYPEDCPGYVFVSRAAQPAVALRHEVAPQGLDAVKGALHAGFAVYETAGLYPDK